jgi:hypothetical protein
MKFFLSLMVLGLGLAALVVHASPLVVAQTNAPTNAPTAPASETESGGEGLIPCGTSDSEDGTRPSDSCTVEDIFRLIARVTNWLITFAGIFAVVRIVIAGFGMVTSVGSPEGISKNKKALTNAIIGLGIVLIAFILINTVVFTLLGLEGENFLETGNLLNFISVNKR